MTRDFTLDKYSELVQAIKQNYTIMRVADYLTLPKDGFIAVVRHDTAWARGGVLSASESWIPRRPLGGGR